MSFPSLMYLIGVSFPGAGGVVLTWSATSKSARMPICTVPVLGGKLYVINSPTLISAAVSCPSMSFDPFILVFARNVQAVSKEDMQRLKDPEYMHTAKKPFHPSMSGEPLREVIGAALGEIAGELDGLGYGGEVCEVPDIGNWLKNVISQAVMAALYGDKNPMTLERLDDVWWVPMVKAQASRATCKELTQLLGSLTRRPPS